MSTTVLGQAVGGSSTSISLAPRKPSLRLRLLAVLMRRMPTEIRRVDMLWHALYHRLGGGTYTEHAATDRRWPAGLQPGVRGTLHKQLMFLDLQDWSDRRAYFSGRFYQQDITRLLLSVLRPGDQYLDIGANIGMTTLVAASCIGHTGRGFAFEPNPEAFARLSRHIDANGLKNFEAVPAALSDCEGVAKLYVSGSHTGSSSLSQCDEGSTQYVEVCTRLGNEFADRLDPLIPTVIKIDVEGYEVQAFQGMSRILSQPEVFVVAEVSEEMLRRAGQSREILHARLRAHGLDAYSMELVARRWGKRLELRRLDGAQNLPKYDAVFVRPGTKLHRRIEPFIAANSSQFAASSA